MANIFYFPFVNPIRLYKPDPSTLYHSRHMDDFEFFDSIPEWEEQVEYYQPWQKDDLIKLQIQADFGPHSVSILDEGDNVISTVLFQVILTNVNNTNLKLYQLDIDLSALDEGIYRLKYSGGIDDPLILISNPIDICESHEHSLVLDYQHHQYDFGVVWDAYFPTLRVEGSNLFKTPASKDQSYEDQPLDLSLVSSTPYRIYELTIGDSGGVPPYMIDLINRILSCSTFLIDGRRFTKSEGAKWEVNEVDGFPAKGWKIELRETINRPSRIFENSEPVNARIAIVINADSKGFGTDTGGSTYEISDVV